MKMWLIWTAAALVAVIALAWIAGALLPQAHVATVEQRHPAPPETVWALITAFEKQSEWRQGVTKVTVAGGRVVEHHQRFGEMGYRVAEMDPPRRLVTKEAGGPEHGFTGSWEFLLQPDGPGTRLTITERGEVFHPLFRLMARFVFGYETTMRQYQSDLSATLAARGAGSSN
jgi:uncharacterized protein YndB with AHSA1/START domain